MNFPLRVVALAVVAVMGWTGCVVAQEQAGQSQRPRGQDAHHDLKEHLPLPTRGVAVLHPSEGSKVRGVILLDQHNDGLHIHGKVVGLTPGKHGFHIHEFGDLRDPKGESAGGHFDPHGHKHGGPGSEEHHAGDLGNIEANAEGVAEVNIKAPWLKLHFVIGRPMVVHGDPDDLTSQPSGAAGPRVALGVIGIAKSDEAPQKTPTATN